MKEQQPGPAARARASSPMTALASACAPRGPSRCAFLGRLPHPRQALPLPGPGAPQLGQLARQDPWPSSASYSLGHSHVWSTGFPRHRGKTLFITQLHALICHMPRTRNCRFWAAAHYCRSFRFWLAGYVGTFLPVFFLILRFYLFLSQFVSGFIFHLQNLFKFKFCSDSNFACFRNLLIYKFCLIFGILSN
jgi:hypothetical protein